MQTLTIKAASLESAHGLAAALANFDAELVEGEGANYSVTVPLGRGDSQIIAVLNAIEQYVTDRNDGPALPDLDGRSYRLHPTPGS